MPSTVPLNELNPEKQALSGEALHWAEKSIAEPFERFDEADEDTLNRILWFAMKGDTTPYPAALAGAHGAGLKGKRLVLTGEDDDDDE